MITQKQRKKSILSVIAILLLSVFCSSFFTGCGSQYVGTWNAYMDSEDVSGEMILTRNGDFIMTVSTHDSLGIKQSRQIQGTWKKTVDGIEIHQDGFDESDEDATGRMTYVNGRLVWSFKDTDETMDFIKE